MMILLSGAILDIALDALSVLGFDMGTTGAALATVIGQIASFAIAIWYCSIAPLLGQSGVWAVLPFAELMAVFCCASLNYFETHPKNPFLFR